jgi:hypothetical protein
MPVTRRDKAYSKRFLLSMTNENKLCSILQSVIMERLRDRSIRLTENSVAHESEKEIAAVIASMKRSIKYSGRTSHNIQSYEVDQLLSSFSVFDITRGLTA